MADVVSHHADPVRLESYFKQLTVSPAPAVQERVDPPPSLPRDCKTDEKSRLDQQPVSGAVPSVPPSQQCALVKAEPSKQPGTFGEQLASVLSARLLSAPAERKHSIFGVSFSPVFINAAYSTTSATFGPLNGVSAGTGAQSRLGVDTVNHHLTVHLKAFLDNSVPLVNASGGFPFKNPPHIRHLIYWDHYPTQVTALNPAFPTDANPPSSVNAAHGTYSLGTTMQNLALKNYVTNPRYTVIYDEMYNWDNAVPTTSYNTATGQYNHLCNASFVKKIHIDLKGVRTKFSDSNAFSFVQGCLVQQFLSDCPSTQAYMIPTVCWLSDVSFTDPQ